MPTICFGVIGEKKKQTSHRTHIFFGKLINYQINNTIVDSEKH
jgi:hypothetical protein